MPVRGELLRHHVFRKHPLIDLEFSQQDVAVKLVRGLGVVGEQLANQKPRIGHVALERSFISGCRKAHRRIVDADARGAYARIRQPEEGVRILPATCVAVERGQHKLLLVACQLTGQGREHAADAQRVGTAELLDVAAVQRQDVALNLIHFSEILFGNICANHLRHASNQHVFTEKPFRFAMNSLGQRGIPLKGSTNNRSKLIFALRPKELFKVQRIQAKCSLLGRNDNALDVAPNGYERTSFEIVVPTVRNKLFDELPCRREALHLVEHDEGISTRQRNARECLQVHEKGIHVRAIVAKQHFEVIGRFGEVYD